MDRVIQKQGWGSIGQQNKVKNNTYKHNQRAHNSQHNQRVTSNLSGLLDKHNDITNDMLESDTIMKYLNIINITNTQLRKWYEGILKIITNIKKLLNDKSNVDIRAQDLLKIELNIFKLIAQINYDISRNFKKELQIYPKKLLKTLTLLQGKLKFLRESLTTQTNKTQAITEIEDYIAKLETFWMSLIAYSKKEKTE